MFICLTLHTYMASFVYSSSIKQHYLIKISIFTSIVVMSKHWPSHWEHFELHEISLNLIKVDYKMKIIQKKLGMKGNQRQLYWLRIKNQKNPDSFSFSKINVSISGGYSNIVSSPLFSIHLIPFKKLTLIRLRKRITLNSIIYSSGQALTGSCQH